MTPALQKMVEAMVAELNRQASAGSEGTGYRAPYVDDGVSEIDPTPDFNSILIDGRVDLEKIARAGLRGLCNMETTPAALGQDIFGILKAQP